MQEEGAIRVAEVPQCMLCKSEGDVIYRGLTDRFFGVAGLWNSRRCEDCGLAWIDPMPLEEDVPRLYANYYTHDEQQVTKSPQEKLKRGLITARFGYTDEEIGRIWRVVGWLLSLVGPAREKVEADIMSLTPPTGKLLDVGCGNGEFLVKMKRLGWKPHGIEPDSVAAGIAKRQLSSDVYIGTLEQADFPDDYFDAITMNHVIEHVPDPVATLRECRRILEPGGRLIIATPNYDSLGHRIFRGMWRALEIPRHLHLFSPRSLVASAELAGLTSRSVRTPAAMAYWMWKIGWTLRRGRKVPGGEPEAVSIPVRLSGFGFWAFEHLVSRTHKYGEEVWLVATKS